MFLSAVLSYRSLVLNRLYVNIGKLIFGQGLRLVPAKFDGL